MPAFGHGCCFEIITLVLNFNSIGLMTEKPCNETRCICGHLIARWRKIGIELKCKRCKHLVVLRYEAIQQEEPSRTVLPRVPAKM